MIEDNLSPADRKLADAVQTGLDDNDFSAVSHAAEAALLSTEPEVRKAAVDALAWFGEKSLEQLTKVLMDKDADVAEAARGQVEHVLMGIDDEKYAFRLAAMYVNAYADAPENIVMFTGIIESTAVSICEPSDADSPEAVNEARGNRTAVVKWTADIPDPTPEESPAEE